MTRFWVVVAVSAWLGTGVRPAVAQKPEDRRKRESEDVHLRNDCRGLLRAELASGRAHVDVAECGPSLVPAIAEAIRELKTESGASRTTDRVLVYALNFRAPEIFDAALEVAGDGAATPHARITAMMIVVAQHDNAVLIGGVRGFRRVYTVPLGERCSYDVLTDRSYRLERSLAADYRARASATLERIRRAPQESLLLRRFAACAERIVEKHPEVIWLRHPGRGAVAV